MAKNPADIPKHLRMETLKKVFERWHRLEKNQIDSLVSAALDVPVEALTRVLYRDLAELVDLAWLQDIHFTRDGIEIKNYDPKVHRNTTCHWVCRAQNAATAPLPVTDY